MSVTLAGTAAAANTAGSTAGAGVVGLGPVATVMAANKLTDIILQNLPEKWYNKLPSTKRQKAREARLEEFQRRMQQDSQDYQRQLQEDSFRFQSDQQDKNFIFQIHRDEEQRLFQLELEAHRLAFQEKLEMRRLQFQEQMEEKRAELQRTLTELNIRNSQQIAQFQAIAMRETQILVARENAQNTLQDRMVQAALKDFPLNISPLVLLKNRPHSLSSLLRFTIGQECRAIDVYNDVMSYAANPEALNIFVAPVYVDNKIRNRQVLSEQIWDTTYQKLESFFTKYYNRRSKRPVIFYPTAWNDKFNPGMHASETLHFFLKDMPCVVIEPRFDGLNFRLMISAWGLGYTSTEHIRTEMNFNINIDEILAKAAYERSKKALKVLDVIDRVDIPDKEKRPFFDQERILKNNVKLYEALEMEERMASGQMEDIEAMGIYNIFKVEPVQDLSGLSDMLTSEIGTTLAVLSDIHHLRATEAAPIFPQLMKEEKYFVKLLDNKSFCRELFESYEEVLTAMREEAKSLASAEDVATIVRTRNNNIDNIGSDLGIELKKDAKEDVERQIREHTLERWGFEDDGFANVWKKFLFMIDDTDVDFCESILHKISDKNMLRQLESQMENI